MEKSYMKEKYFHQNLFKVVDFLSLNGRKTELAKVKEKFRNEISSPILHSILMDLDMYNFIELLQMKDRRKKIVYLTDYGFNLRKKLGGLEQLLR